jgi:cytochrome c oxidase assembly protein subunit 15
LIAATLLQVLLGSQVREAVQEISHRVPALSRGEWMEEVGWMDAVHRSFSWAVLGLSLAWYFAMRKAAVSGLLLELGKLNNSAVVIQILLGVGLAYGGVPPVLQLFHLVVAAFMTSVQFGALLLIAHAPNNFIDGSDRSSPDPLD